jgi:hypothetical protein
LAAAQAAAVGPNPFLALSMNGPGFHAAQQNPFLMAAAASQGQPGFPGALGPPGGLVFLPRLP